LVFYLYESYCKKSTVTTINFQVSQKSQVGAKEKKYYNIIVILKKSMI